MSASGTGARRSRKQTKSHIVGPATHTDDGIKTTAFVALVPLECGHCGRAIAPGELFTRHTRPQPRAAGDVTPRVAVCAACRPFRVEGMGDCGTPGSTAGTR